MIISRDNPHVKIVRSLISPHGRSKSDLYFIEGTKLIEEAVRADEDIEFALYSTDFNDSSFLDLIANKGIEIFELSSAAFADITDTVTPQGILAVLRQQRRDWHDMVSMDRCLALALDAVQDPGNAGTMIRTADAMGFNAVIAGQGTADQYNPKVLRAAMGSSFHIPVYSDVPLTEILTECTERISVLATVPRGGISIDESPLSDRTIVIIGNEARGISEEVMDKATCFVSIAMPGRAESLNASVAAGIAMYGISRRWHSIR